MSENVDRENTVISVNCQLIFLGSRGGKKILVQGQGTHYSSVKQIKFPERQF